jgi:acylphosphatase
MALRAAHIYVSGRVQGVNFRFYTRQEAVRLGVDGWVRNLMDGRVEAWIQGEEEAVAQMIAWCRHGPPSARVDDVQVEWETPRKDLSRFGVAF